MGRGAPASRPEYCPGAVAYEPVNVGFDPIGQDGHEGSARRCRWAGLGSGHEGVGVASMTEKNGQVCGHPDRPRQLR